MPQGWSVFPVRLNQTIESKQSLFPVFMGESVHIEDDSEESKILARFIQSSEYRILDSKFKGYDMNVYNNEITVSMKLQLRYGLFIVSQRIPKH